MSLLPFLYSNWLEEMDHPHSLVDQHFGHGINLEHLPAHSHAHHLANRNRLPFYYTTMTRDHPASRCPVSAYVRPWSELLRQGQGGVSTVKADKNQFQVSLDVQQFAPEEINVKVVDKTVVVEGKHEEKQDEHGFVSRQFVRKYMIPEQCDIEQVTSKLSSDGVLTIEVPRKDKPEVNGERTINIEHTGKPAIRENGETKAADEQPKEDKK